MNGGIDEYTYQILLKNASVVVHWENADSVEKNIDLIFREGRRVMFIKENIDGITALPVLKYYGNLLVDGAFAPTSSEEYKAKICVSAELNGKVTILNGDGWFGYDENGYFEGWFDDPPTIQILGLGSSIQENLQESLSDQHR